MLQLLQGTLASGLLGGEFNSETKFSENDHRNYNINGKAFDIGDTFSGINFNKGLDIVEKIKKFFLKIFQCHNCIKMGSYA